MRERGWDSESQEGRVRVVLGGVGVEVVSKSREEGNFAAITCDQTSGL